ncbi:DNA-3-methyladenine glycosylase I [Henriciella aquimarina]|uniref:DNA-3-methyladenine glycosylase I n=1 Tax=Henriciella aquimarina TaxID=545261 RepID=UPI000A046F0D|nr:DNA-3-methyladenine glycosylase I [Henriciella aquimarina]
MGLYLSPDETLHCRWAPAEDALYRAYHDEEWGVPEYDSRALWEKLQLDGMQAGLSWITILRKREAIREEFDGFVPESIARWDQARIEKALQNPGIIRSPKKIQATIGNARAYLDMMAAGEDFSDWLWSFTGGTPIVNQLRDVSEVPAKTPLSEELSKALKKKGFKFCGPVIVYAFMQAVGMVNDHETRCPRHKEIQELHA